MTSLEMATCWQKMLNSFEANEFDIPLAAMYSFDVSDSTVNLEGGLGISKDCSAMAQRARLDETNHPLVSFFKKASTSGQLSIFQHARGEVPEGIFDDVSWRGFGEPSNVIAVLPLFVGEDLAGFVLLGLNPRRIYDDEYDRYLRLLNRQLTVSLTSAASIDEARKKQAELSKDLAAEESRFKAMTELNTAGYG